jgi:flagellar biosynthesis protein FlhB
VVAVGVLTEYLQTGPVFTFERLTPKLDNMNPVEGVKRMFSMDNLIEIAKAAAKTAALLTIGWLAISDLLPQIVHLPFAQRPEAVGSALWATARPVLVWTVALFALLSLLDMVYQRWSFTKKMRMSRRDIRQEMKDNEGDPYIKAQRRQTHEEWSQRNAQQAARGANALIVNPTHVAIAIDYDRETCPVPTIAAKGEDHVARAMREAAEEAGVPIVRNVPLARDLLARAEVGELIPADLFDVIAEVILWAREVRDEMASDERSSSPSLRGPAPSGDPSAAARRRKPPGEDLSRYPGVHP